MNKIVLVRPKYPRNIGMAARAMTNFGWDQLILINPHCEISDEAKEGAARGQGPLETCETYEDWQSFLNSQSHCLRVAFTRREGQRRPVQDLPTIAQWAKEQVVRRTGEQTARLGNKQRTPPCAFIFGPEDHGLSQDDINHVHQLCSFQLSGDQKSMNLSHAVLFFLTQWESVTRAFREPVPQYSTGHGDDTGARANKGASTDTEATLFPSLDRLENRLRSVLEELGFDLSREKWNRLIAIKQLLRRAAPDDKEMKMIEDLSFQILRRLHKSASDCTGTEPVKSQ